jgi:hypothetical protein
MAVTTDQMYQVFQSIDASLKALTAHFGAGKPAQLAAGSSVPLVASDSDLDGKWGDEVVKFDPRDWSGDNFAHGPMSACPEAYLLLYAQAYDYFAERDDASGEKDAKGKPKSFYAKRTASRARGWAARKRNGWVPPETDTATSFPSDGFPSNSAPLTDDDVPF